MRLSTVPTDRHNYNPSGLLNPYNNELSDDELEKLIFSYLLSIPSMVIIDLLSHYPQNIIVWKSLDLKKKKKGGEEDSLGTVTMANPTLDKSEVQIYTT